MSRLPPCGPGGTECGRSSPADRDAHDARGTARAGSGPTRVRAGGSRQQPTSAVRGLVDARANDAAPARRPAGTPPAGRRGRAGWRSRRTARAARGRRPRSAAGRPAGRRATAIGPGHDVRAVVRRRRARMAGRRARRASSSTASAAPRAARRTRPGPGPGPRSTPSWLTVSIVTTVPGSTVEHGRVGGAGQPAPEHGLRRRGQVDVASEPGCSAVQSPKSNRTASPRSSPRDRPPAPVARRRHEALGWEGLTEGTRRCRAPPTASMSGSCWPSASRPGSSTPSATSASTGSSRPT